MMYVSKIKTTSDSTKTVSYRIKMRIESDKDFVSKMVRF